MSNIPASILALVVHLPFHKDSGIGGTSDMDTVRISDPDFVAKSAWIADGNGICAESADGICAESAADEFGWTVVWLVSSRSLRKAKFCSSQSICMVIGACSYVGWTAHMESSPPVNISLCFGNTFTATFLHSMSNLVNLANCIGSGKAASMSVVSMDVCVAQFMSFSHVSASLTWSWRELLFKILFKIE